jgi:hypothetical protein
LGTCCWQAAHGWPQLDPASGIAAGSSGTSASRWVFLPYLLVLISPFLVPVWAIGGWRLARLPELHRYRAFPTAFVILTVFVATGGKPYYLVGLYPVLLAAGADPVVAWAAGRRVRRVLVGSALAASLAVAAYLFLSLLPVDRLAGSLPAAVDYDAGETVGWPRFGLTIAQAYSQLSETEQRRAVLWPRMRSLAEWLRRPLDAVGILDRTGSSPARWTREGSHGNSRNLRRRSHG